MKRLYLSSIIMILFASLLSAQTVIEVDETDPVKVNLKVSDPDSDNLSITYTAPLDDNGFWQTEYSDAGEYDVVATVTDGDLSSTKNIKIIVNKVNVIPTIDQLKPSDSTLSIKEAESLEFAIEASDKNKDPLTITWKVDDNEASKEASFTYKTDYGDEGAHTISVKVSDGEEEVEQEWKVNVEKVDRESLLDKFTDITAKETDTITLNVPDFSSFNLEYKISEPFQNDQWKTTYKDAGEYEVTITLTDREFKAKKTFIVTIENIDRPPQLTPIANVWMKENQKVSFPVEATDPDGEEIDISIESLPAGASFDGSTFTWETNHDTVIKDNIVEKALDKFHLLYAPFKINFIAKSKGVEALQTMYIFVKEENRAPALNDVPSVTVEEGEIITLEPTGTDPDGDTLQFTYEGFMSRKTKQTDFENEGTYTVYVTASDGFLTDTKKTTVTVKNKNQAPSIDPIKPVNGKETKEISFSVITDDLDGQPVTTKITNLPKGAVFNENKFTWTPNHDVASHRIPQEIILKLQATDGQETTETDVLVTVEDVNRAPILKTATPQKEQNWITGRPIDFITDAVDPDGDTLEYTWKFGFLESYDATAGMRRTFSTPGKKKVAVEISDGLETIEHEWIIQVFNPVSS